MAGNSKDLYDYWYSKVEFKNEYLISAPYHTEVYTLRHECTNYDELRESEEVRTLKRVEREKTIAVIKYQCTARVLQRRAVTLRNLATKLVNKCSDLDAEISRRDNIITAFQELLFGKDRKIEQLESEITELRNEISKLRDQADEAESQKDWAYHELHTELEQLKQRYKEIAKKNQSLGGKLAHTERYKRERDEARERAEQQEQQISALMEELERLR